MGPIETMSFGLNMITINASPLIVAVALGLLSPTTLSEEGDGDMDWDIFEKPQTDGNDTKLAEVDEVKPDCG